MSVLFNIDPSVFFMDKRNPGFFRCCVDYVREPFTVSSDQNDNSDLLSIQQNHLVFQPSWNAPWKICSSSYDIQWLLL